jgi:hypothetical protein
MGRPRKYTDEERKANLASYQKRYYERNRDKLLIAARDNYLKRQHNRAIYNGAMISPNESTDLIFEEIERNQDATA